MFSGKSWHFPLFLHGLGLHRSFTAKETQNNSLFVRIDRNFMSSSSRFATYAAEIKTAKSLQLNLVDIAKLNTPVA